MKFDKSYIQDKTILSEVHNIHSTVDAEMRNEFLRADDAKHRMRAIMKRRKLGECCELRSKWFCLECTTYQISFIELM